MKLRLLGKKGVGAALLALACTAGVAHAGARPAPGDEPARRGLWQRAHPLAVERGVLTVDGVVVKTGMNFRVADLRYLFVDVPGSGTAVISDRNFAGAREQKRAFKSGVLTVYAGDSRLELSAAHKVHGNGSAYVRFDRGAGNGSRVPQVGYANSMVSRVNWVEDAGGVVVRRHRVVTVSTGRHLRQAKLCRPSRRGAEKCAIVNEMRYHE